jgi:hypothetical protein
MNTTIEVTEKSLLAKYQKDHSQDPFIIKKGENAIKLLKKANYLLRK